MSLVAVVVGLSLAAAPELSYADAYRQMEQSGRPLLVLVGADWCPGCRTMKANTVPELRKAGHLETVIYAQVDTDKQPDLSRRLMRGASIPQLLLFTRNGDEWRRTQLTGAQNMVEVRAFLEREIASHQSKPGATPRASND
ncbi:MAG: thioredoxin family protein [Planctomycetes bacterium]|nr:thioredoxin family protein [Planctomycetota bacterium]